MKYLFRKLFWGTLWSKLMTVALAEIIANLVYIKLRGGTKLYLILWSSWFLVCLLVRLIKKYI